MLSSVFSIRRLFLIFSGIIGLISISTGLIKQGKLHCEEEYEKKLQEINSNEEVDDAEFLENTDNSEEIKTEEVATEVVPIDESGDTIELGENNFQRETSEVLENDIQS